MFREDLFLYNCLQCRPGVAERRCETVNEQKCRTVVEELCQVATEVVSEPECTLEEREVCEEIVEVRREDGASCNCKFSKLNCRPTNIR